MNDERLFRHYLEMKGPEAGQWNASPKSLLMEFAVRDFVSRMFSLFAGMKVCNVGVGTGDWDDYLGYWLNGHGSLTSVDIDAGICELFAYRQKREEHPNPSEVWCRSIFDPDLPHETFDLVTIIGSTIPESGGFTGCLDACFRMIKPGGSLMLMAIEKFTPMNRVEEYIRQTDFLLLRREINETFPDLSFYMYQVGKQGESA